MGGGLHLRGHPGGHRLYRAGDRRVRRLIAGWRTAASHSTDLVLDALVMAVTYRARQGVKVAGLTHRSDAGSETCPSGTAPSWPRRASRRRSGPSGTYDNALAESIIGLYKTEVTDHQGPWETPARSRPPPANGRRYNTARVMRRTGGARGRKSRLAGRHARPGPRRGPGSRPRRHEKEEQKEAAMAAAHYPGGLRRPRGSARTPALLRDGPAGHDGCGGGRASPRGAGGAGAWCSRCRPR